MKTSLLKKICSLILATSLYIVAVHAQIVYTDVNPDITASCSPNCSIKHNLDINNDGISDFYITTKSKIWGAYLSCHCPDIHRMSSVTITRLYKNAVLIGDPFNYNDIISSNLVNSF